MGPHALLEYGIQTRQKQDELFESVALLPSAATFSSPDRLVSGYGSIRFLVFSDRNFRLRIEESAGVDQPFVETARFDSAVNPSGVGSQIVCTSVSPCGTIMRIFVDNESAFLMTTFQLEGQGLPIGGAGGAGGGGGGGTEQDDNAIAQGQTLPLSIIENYIHNGTTWIRLQGGVDNAVAPASPQGAFFGGIVTDPVDVFVDGDISLAHFDTSGRLLVSSIEGVSETDDGSIASGQTTGLEITIPYVFDGATWVRSLARDANPAIDQTLDYSLVRAAISGIDSNGGAGSEVVAVNTEVVSDGILTDTDTGFITLTKLFAERRAAGTVQNINSDRGDEISGVAVTAVTGLYTNAIAVGIDSTGADVFEPIEARAPLVDADLAEALIGLTTNSRLAIRGAADFEIWNGGTENAAAIATPAGAFVGGVVTDPVDVFVDGDVSLLHFDTSGRLLTTATATLTETDDDAIAIGQVLDGVINLPYFSNLDNTSIWERWTGRDDDGSITSGDGSPTVIGLNYNFDGTNWVRTLARPANTAIDQALDYGLIRAAVSGIDSGAGAGSEVLAVEARNFNNGATDVDESLIGLLTNSRMAVWQNVASNWRNVFGDTPSGVDGLAATSAIALYTNAIIAGTDNTGAAVLRPVETRNADATADVAASLIGLLTQARNAVFDADTSDWALEGGVAVIDGAAPAMDFVAQARDSGYVASRFGRRFTVTSAGNNIAGDTAFSAISPQVLIDTDSTNDQVIKKITVSLAVAGGATPVNVRVIIDTASRFSSGGTSRTPGNENTSDATAASGDAYLDGAVVAIAAVGAREIGDEIMENVAGKKVVFDFEDGLIIGVDSALLVYWNSGTTAPECRYEIEFEDAVIQ